MQIDLPPELPLKGAYQNIITAIDAFSRYAFAYLVSNPAAVNTANIFIDSMTRHAYLPTFMVTDKGPVFVSNVIHKIANVLSSKLRPSTIKHAQTIVVLEGTHATIKMSLNLSSGEFGKQWNKKLPLFILNYNTTYHKSIGYLPS